MNDSARLHRIVMLTVTLMTAGSTVCAKPLRDPTRPLVSGDTGRASAPGAPHAVAAKPAALMPQLQMVLIGPGRRYVVINGVLLSQGDDFNGLRIVEIRPDGVVLQAAGGLRLLPLLAPAAELPATAVPAK